mmetsp:Transcript_4265/g.7142  ORF Transcript_4265/g.7142 Transcript_4265/m.7142 type:complete len:102 (-) Transcript_4265:62-367(-)|eukprot:CAMPEP_0119320916 /NCGR_PEP_ID=MMETSP1333-20130426/53898_1 /TAXON_ID=418940 /ORGANISM="Scyphosphaera apsteinii, Strain RCC1455" /LENGTH=101 /DNA_ID=CAMNT_0007327751 /DNA_START=176 /DNA_END=481 /DNA_ORIENTATION=+
MTTTNELIPILKRNERLRALHEKHMRLIGETDISLDAGDPLWLAAMDDSIDIFPLDAAAAAMEDVTHTKDVGKSFFRAKDGSQHNRDEDQHGRARDGRSVG